MKPDDILSAIGDVEEKYVKRAHGKDLVKALAWFFGTLAVLLIITGNRMEPDYILSRINPDFTVNTGYVEPEHLEEDHWTTLEHTAFENGMETARTVFKRTLYDHYTVTHTPAQGESQILAGGGVASARDYLGEKDISTFYMETYYSEDLIGRIDSMTIGSRFAHETPNVLLNYVKMEYSEGVFPLKQTRYSSKEDIQPVGWRLYSTCSSGVSQTRDYDAHGNLVGYTDYTYDGTCRSSESHTAEGILIGSTQSHYDWLGRLRKRETYDAEGNLTGQEIYRYRFWERYLSLEGLITLFCGLCLAATMGIASWEERLRLPRRKDNGALIRAKAGLRQAEQAMEGMEKPDREALAEELRRILKQIEEGTE